MMKFIRKYIVFIVLFVVLFLSLFKIFQGGDNKQQIDSNQVNLYFFYGQGCPHCAKEELFLDKLENKYSQIDIHRYETWYNTDNANLLDKLRGKLSFKSGVPVLIVGDKAIVGYSNYEITGKRIENLVSDYVVEGCSDMVAPSFSPDDIVAGDFNNDTCDYDGCDVNNDKCEQECDCSVDMSGEGVGKPDTLNVPFFGEVHVKNLTMPLFTILIAAADGFNPCAMWVLLFLMSLLISMDDKKRMWILGFTFIFSSAVVYYFFVFTWLQLFLLVGLVLWVRLVIGLVAVGSGTYHLKEYFENRKGTCKVTDNEKRKKIFIRLSKIVKEKKMFLAMSGIVLLAAAVNMVELLCSAGFPQTFTQVLALKNLGFWQNQAYIFLYIFIFMLDDLLVFIIIMKTMQLKGVSSKYSRWSNLIGGVLILLIGLLLIFKPEWIMFG